MYPQFVCLASASHPGLTLSLLVHAEKPLWLHKPPLSIENNPPTAPPALNGWSCSITFGEENSMLGRLEEIVPNSNQVPSPDCHKWDLT